MLRQPFSRQIIFIIFNYEVCLLNDLVNELKKHKSTILFHLKKLMDDDIVKIVQNNKGLIKRKKEGYIIRDSYPNVKFYRLNDAEQIQSLLIKYQDSLTNDSISDTLLHWYLEYDKYKKKPIVKIHDRQFDQAIKTFYELFNLYCVRYFKKYRVFLM